MATHNMINNGTFRNILEHDPIGKEAFLVNVLYLKKKTGINYSWIGLLAQMQTLSFTYTHLLWVHKPWAHEIISPEGHGCYCAKKKKKWRSWEKNMETFLKAFSLQNRQHLFKFTEVSMFDFLVVVLSACSGALHVSMLNRGDFL